MNRRSNWRSALFTVIKGFHGTAFAWGTNDCAVFASRGIYAMTGVNPRTSFPANYHTAIGALLALHNLGFTDLNELVASFLQPVPGGPSSAQVGDLAAIQGTAVGWGLGFFLGERIGVLGADGYATIARSEATLAYAIGPVAVRVRAPFVHGLDINFPTTVAGGVATIHADVFEDEDVFYIPILDATYGVLPGLLTDAEETFYAPQGVGQIVGPLLIDLDTFYDMILGPLRPELLNDDADVFYDVEVS